MINTETLRLMLTIKDLTAKSKKKMIPFSKAKKKHLDSHIIYDDREIVSEGDTHVCYHIIKTARLDRKSRDVGAYLDSSDYENTEILAVFDKFDNSEYVEIIVNNDNENPLAIIIENGDFYEAT